MTLDKAIKAVQEEPELSGDMPDILWEKIQKDRESASKICRAIVKETKNGIIKRLLRDGLKEAEEYTNKEAISLPPKHR